LNKINLKPLDEEFIFHQETDEFMPFCFIVGDIETLFLLVL